MGNYSSNIKDIIDEHQKLHNKIENNNLDENLIIFNIPITFDYHRQFKSYDEEIYNASLQELSNTTYNELYLSSLGINITSDSVQFISVDKLNICTLSTYDDDKNKTPIKIFKHFNLDTDPIPETISINVNNINELMNQIKKLEQKIKIEKDEILNSEYVKSKLNKPMKKTNDYVRTVKYLNDKIRYYIKGKKNNQNSSI